MERQEGIPASQTLMSAARRVIFGWWTGREAGQRAPKAEGSCSCRGEWRGGQEPRGQQLLHAPALRSPAPESPFQAHPSHSLRAPALAFPSGDTRGLPHQPLLGAKQLPMTLPPAAMAPAAPAKLPGAFAKQKASGVPKLAGAGCAAGPRARGMCAPQSPLPSSSLCEFPCGSPAASSSSNGSPCLSLQKRLRMPASPPSATGPTWRAPSS